MEAIRVVSPMLFAGWSVCLFPYKLYSLYPLSSLFPSPSVGFCPVCASSLPRPTFSPRKGVGRCEVSKSSLDSRFDRPEPEGALGESDLIIIGRLGKETYFNQPWSGSIAGWLRGRGGKSGWEVSRWKERKGALQFCRLSGENVETNTPSIEDIAYWLYCRAESCFYSGSQDRGRVSTWEKVETQC